MSASSAQTTTGAFAPVFGSAGIPQVPSDSNISRNAIFYIVAVAGVVAVFYMLKKGGK